jgi:hypothetical protein
MTTYSSVVKEAVRAAWDSYRVLENRTSPEERRQAQERIAEASREWGRNEVARGSVLLVGMLAAEAIRGSQEEDGTDPLWVLLPGLLSKLRTFELDESHMPMVAGTLTAALLGQDTVAWRDQFGSIPAGEALALGFTLWLLADLYDFSSEEPGAMDRTMQEVFDSLSRDDA